MGPSNGGSGVGDGQVQLRTPDADEVRGIEPGQRGGMTSDGGLTGDEDLVVGLRLVADHADLVALAVVHVDVDRLLERQRLEVRPAVVDVDDRVEVGPVVQRHEDLVPGHEEHPQGRQPEQRAVRLDVADDHDRRHVRPRLEDRKPLGQLVELGRAVREVERDIGAGHVGEIEAVRLDLSELAHPTGHSAGRLLGEAPDRAVRRLAWCAHCLRLV